jgi:integrase
MLTPKLLLSEPGWSDTKMWDRYQHVMPNMQKQAAETFGKLFFDSKAT